MLNCVFRPITVLFLMYDKAHIIKIMHRELEMREIVHWQRGRLVTASHDSKCNFILLIF